MLKADGSPQEAGEKKIDLCLPSLCCIHVMALAEDRNRLIRSTRPCNLQKKKKVL